MVIKSYLYKCDQLSSFSVDIILHTSHDLLGIRLIEANNETSFSQLELQYGRHEYINEKTVRKERWECILAKKKADIEIPTKDNTRLELIREFKSDTHYLFRIIKT
jgi:hypothetical protein